MPKKLLISAFILLVFFKSTYLKSSCENPCQLINQFLVSLNAQKQIGININNLISKELIVVLINKTIGTGATDQKGSYKLEFFN